MNETDQAHFNVHESFPSWVKLNWTISIQGRVLSLALAVMLPCWFLGERRDEKTNGWEYNWHLSSQGGDPWEHPASVTQPRSMYDTKTTSIKIQIQLYFIPSQRERERDVRIVREDTQNLPVMVWFNFSPQYDEVMSLTIILSDFDWDWMRRRDKF